jgi:hypothetical protein
MGPVDPDTMNWQLSASGFLAQQLHVTPYSVLTRVVHGIYVGDFCVRKVSSVRRQSVDQSISRSETIHRSSMGAKKAHSEANKSLSLVLKKAENKKWKLIATLGKLFLIFCSC